MTVPAATMPSPQNDASGGAPRPPRPSARAARSALASLAINFVVPLLAYYLIHPHVRSSALALALAGGIPVAWTLAILVVRRRLDPIGVVSVVSFGVGVLISWASGGSALALELQDPELTGLIGLVFLGSVAIGKPLHPVILRWLGRSNPHYIEVANRAQGRTSAVTTTVLGLTLLAHAVAVAVLALTQTTSTFVALQHPVGLPIFVAGVGSLYLYHHRLQARQRTAARAGQPADDQAEGTS
jgi:hypothetical protein